MRLPPSLPSRPRRGHVAGVLVALACLLTALDATAAGAPGPRDERAEPLPDELQGVGVDEHLDAVVPGDIVLRDENGQAVRLGDYFDQGRPIILNLMYLGCPMLCGLIGNGLTDAMKQLAWTAGEEFTVLSASFDPRDGPTAALAKKESYLASLDRPAARDGWHFLTGEEDQIQRLTGAVGFGYRWNEEQQQFAHAAVVVVLTPAGHVARYLYGVQFDPKTLRLSLVEAADGKIGSSRDRLLLFCFNYDPSTGQYSPAVLNIMKAGGLLTVVVLAILIFSFRRHESKRRRREHRATA